MNIYLCDLTHEVGLRTRVVPLGVGTLACALKDIYKDKISTKLFVYPKKIIRNLNLILQILLLFQTIYGIPNSLSR